MKYISVVIFLFLLGCSEIMDTEETSPVETNHAVLSENNGDTEASMEDATQLTHKEHISEYYREPMTKTVNDYAKWIAQDLFANLDYPSNQDVFVIADFALLDSNLNETNHFGRQLTEALMHEANRTGFSVIDTKATGFIRITEKGDVFFHSKDYTELSQKVPATYIIAGTLTKHQGGYLVNARVISMETMAMVSSAQAFVPYTVVEAVLTEEDEQHSKNQQVEDDTVVSAQESEEPSTQSSNVSPPATVGIPLKAHAKNRG